MAFNIVQFFENLFGINKPASPSSPSVLQGAISTAGKALDDAENILDTLQAVAPNLPTPFQGYLSALALAVHGMDAYIDTIETPVPAPVITDPAARPASKSNPAG